MSKRFCRTWTKRYLFTMQTRVKRASTEYTTAGPSSVGHTVGNHFPSPDQKLGPSGWSQLRRWRCIIGHILEDRPVVYPANAFQWLLSARWGDNAWFKSDKIVWFIGSWSSGTFPIRKYLRSLGRFLLYIPWPHLRSHRHLFKSPLLHLRLFKFTINAYICEGRGIMTKKNVIKTEAQARFLWAVFTCHKPEAVFRFNSNIIRVTVVCFSWLCSSLFETIDWSGGELIKQWQDWWDRDGR